MGHPAKRKKVALFPAHGMGPPNFMLGVGTNSHLRQQIVSSLIIRLSGQASRNNST